MAETKCKHCTMIISSEAIICPCCGEKTGISNTAIFFIVTGLFIIFSVLIILNPGQKNTKQSSNAVVTKKITTKRGNINHATEQHVVTKPATDEPTPTLGFKLATINAGGYVAKDNITVARFHSLLGQLSSTYIENDIQIADMTVAAQNLLKKNGIEESLLNIMEGMNQLFPIKIENQKYAEYIAVYATLRHKGQSHADAVFTLQAILQQRGQ